MRLPKCALGLSVLALSACAPATERQALYSSAAYPVKISVLNESVTFSYSEAVCLAEGIQSSRPVQIVIPQAGVCPTAVHTIGGWLQSLWGATIGSVVSFFLTT